MAVFDGRFLRTHNIQRQVSPLLRIVRGEKNEQKLVDRDESDERLELLA